MKPPVPVILDTDMGPDCDDAGALGVLHALAANGEARILGVMHCTSSPWGAGCIDAINAYYGRPDLPVGTLKARGFLDEASYRKYNEAIAKTYPNRFAGGAEQPDAVRLYRRLLSVEADRTVVIIAIGPLPNLRALLASGPDDVSELDGVELVARKVKELVVMGGQFPSGLEWNFRMDADSARHVAERWPTPIMYCGYEIGADIMTGSRLFAEAPADHPVRRAYEWFLGGPGDRNSWDLTAVLYGVRGLGTYFGARMGGKAEVLADGANRWVDAAGGADGYLIRRTAGDDLKEELERLMVQPPSF
jgi:inosine-uridine nucleoside N-ribohydrolase